MQNQKAISNEVLIKIFLTYSHCKAISTQSKKVYNIVGFRNLDGNGMAVCEKQKDCEACIYPAQLQLLLKPLASISDEDKQKVVELMASMEYGELDPDCIPEWFQDVFGIGGNSALMSDYVSGCQFQALIDNLRWWGYDLGYGSIPSLISAGIAIAHPQTTES